MYIVSIKKITYLYKKYTYYHEIKLSINITQSLKKIIKSLLYDIIGILYGKISTYLLIYLFLQIWVLTTPTKK